MLLLLPATVWWFCLIIDKYIPGSVHAVTIQSVTPACFRRFTGHGVDPCLPPHGGMYVQCSPVNGIFESGHPLYNAYVRTDDLSSNYKTAQKCADVILLDLLMP